ncbi:DUF2341 domain-containing protein [Chloroflexota bacterium]
MNRKLMAILVLAVLVASVVPAGMASADPGWSYYSPITIQASKVEANLSSFPVLISLTDNRLKTSPAGHVAQADGGDIAFTDANNTVKYDHEIEKYDGTNGTLVAWVRIPSLSGSSNTTIQMWYGNADCADQWNPEGVWDSNFKMAQHLQEDPTDPSPALKDSTSNDNDGIDYGSMTSDDQVAGQIDGSLDFDGVDDYVDAGSNTVLDNLNDFSVSAWVKPFADSWETPQGDFYGAFASKGDSDSDVGWEAIIHKPSTSTKYALRLAREFSTTDLSYRSTEVLNVAEWYHFVTVYYSSTRTAKLYLDGTEVSYSEQTAGVGSPGDDSAETLQFGHRGPIDDPNPLWLKGLIDEVRISDTARSADWIKTCHNNQSDPSTFHTLGTDVDAGPQEPVPELPTLILMSAGLVVILFLLIRHRLSKAVSRK